MQYSTPLGPLARTLIGLGLLSLILLARPATAGYQLDEPILGGRMLVAETGYVTATFLGSDAGYFNSLYLDAPGTSDLLLFDKHSPVGIPIDLGWFEAGTELIFRLDVRDTGLSFFTGDAPRNPDGLAHALAISTFDDDSGLFMTTVGFEDLLGGGDLDYNDFMFELSNVIDPLGVPAPSALLLIGAGLVALRLRRARDRNHA